MECTNCGKQYDGDDIITFGWLREHNPEVAEPIENTHRTMCPTSAGIQDDEPYKCGTICPHCGYANDAPGYAPGDDIPRQGPDGEWFCASRYLPPSGFVPSPESLMGDMR